MIFFLVLLLFSCNITAKPLITIVPFIGFEHNDVLFSPEERDETTKPFIMLKQALETLDFNVEVSTLENISETTQCIIVLNVPALSVLQRLASCTQKKILFVFEPPTVSPLQYNQNIHQLFNSVYTMVDILKGNRYKKFYYPQPSLNFEISPFSFQQKKFCTLIAGNKNSTFPLELYTARLNTIHFFEQHYPDQFDFYGVGWSYEHHPCYKGQIKTKKNCLHEYKFCICYENTRDLPGYITEKIFDCFVAGCVPVYWGPQNITSYVPDHCFIDRRKFKDDVALYEFLTQVTADEYNTYLQSIENFLASSHAFLFSCHYFIHTILSEINPHYDKKMIFNEQELNAIEKAIMLNQKLQYS